MYLLPKNTYDSMVGGSGAATSTLPSAHHCDNINIRQMNTVDCKSNSNARVTIRNDDNLVRRGEGAPARPPPQQASQVPSPINCSTQTEKPTVAHQGTATSQIERQDFASQTERPNVAHQGTSTLRNLRQDFASQTQPTFSDEGTNPISDADMGIGLEMGEIPELPPVQSQSVDSITGEARQLPEYIVEERRPTILPMPSSDSMHAAVAEAVARIRSQVGLIRRSRKAKRAQPASVIIHAPPSTEQVAEQSDPGTGGTPMVTHSEPAEGEIPPLNSHEQVADVAPPSSSQPRKTYAARLKKPRAQPYLPSLRPPNQLETEGIELGPPAAYQDDQTSHDMREAASVASFDSTAGRLTTEGIEAERRLLSQLEELDPMEEQLEALHSSTEPQDALHSEDRTDVAPLAWKTYPKDGTSKQKTFGIKQKRAIKKRAIKKHAKKKKKVEKGEKLSSARKKILVTAINDAKIPKKTLKSRVQVEEDQDDPLLTDNFYVDPKPTKGDRDRSSKVVKKIRIQTKSRQKDSSQKARNIRRNIEADEFEADDAILDEEGDQVMTAALSKDREKLLFKKWKDHPIHIPKPKPRRK